MLPSLNDALAAELQTLESASRLRTLLPFQGPDRVAPRTDAGPLLSFASNDYLGFANHPLVLSAATEAASTSGFGASASRLVSGDLQEHRALEDSLAALVRTQAALLFPTGYQANIGIVTALAGKDDLILSDAANHASLIDGCRLSRAEVIIYPHLDIGAADTALSRQAGRHRRRFLITESLFSMDGDFAPLPALAALAQKHQAGLIVDEAHAIGIFGPEGAGLCAAHGIVPDALIGTLGKTLGSLGGFVAGTTELRAYLINRARTFIFTTASPAPVAAAALAAVRLVRSSEGDARRRLLRARIAEVAHAFTLHLGRAAPASDSPILPVILGEDRAALAASRSLREHGIFIPAIRPPTVPPGTARLRVTVSAAHTPDQISHLGRSLHAIPRPPAP